MAFQSTYEAMTPYEAKMLMNESSENFARIYDNMRHTLRRRAATLRKYGRTDTAGYEVLMQALETTRGNRKPENFSAISIALQNKMTLYTEQIKQEKAFEEYLLKTHGIKLTKSEVREIFKVAHNMMKSKQGFIKYRETPAQFWDTAIQVVRGGAKKGSIVKAVKEAAKRLTRG